VVGIPHHFNNLDLGDCASNVSDLTLPPRSQHDPNQPNSIYVGYPNLAQKKINKSTLAVTSESITNPTPGAVDIDMETVILTNSSQHPHLDAFDGDLYLEDSDTPFLTLQIPATEAKNGTKATVKQTAQIEHLDAFTDYTIKTLVSDEFSVKLKGKGGLKLGSLPHTTVNYNQKINLKGITSHKAFPEIND
jgi:Protein of unknown function (DUF3712)